jgi:molybdopterin-guanine dinucleotide biosynthesis protein A
MSAILLAGGKSTRMGQDKAFMQWNGKRFLEHVIEAAKSVSSKVILSGDKDRLSEFGLEIIEDMEKDNGPVFALASCFAELADENVLVLSCDVPQINAKDLDFLIGKQKLDADVTCYEYKGKVMPLIGIYSPSSFMAFKNAMENGERKLFSVLNGLKVNTVKYEGVDGLMNINTLQDLKALI